MENIKLSIDQEAGICIIEENGIEYNPYPITKEAGPEEIGNIVSMYLAHSRQRDLMQSLSGLSACKWVYMDKYVENDGTQKTGYMPDSIPPALYESLKASFWAYREYVPDDVCDTDDVWISLWLSTYQDRTVVQINVGRGYEIDILVDDEPIDDTNWPVELKDLFNRLPH